MGDAYTPNILTKKRNYMIVSEEATSIKGIGLLVNALGAIPVPYDFSNIKLFMDAIETRIKEKKSITIYPEAHLWPYYTHIRPFRDTSFTYPVSLKAPVYCFVNTYKKRRNPNKCKIITRIRGPFYADESLPSKEAISKLRNEVYEAMCELSEYSDVELIKYTKKEDKKND